MAPVALADPRGAPALNLEFRLADRQLLKLLQTREESPRSLHGPRGPDTSSVASRFEADASPTVPDLAARKLPPQLPREIEAGTPVQARDVIVTTTAIPAGYGSLTSGPDPGTVVGITLGAVGGFVLLLWIVYWCINLGNPDTTESIGTASVVTRKSRSHRHHRHRSRGRATVEVRQTTTTRPVPVVVEEAMPRAERIVVEERRREMSRGPPPPRVVSADDEDEVVVIEEHSPPRRHRSSQRRSSEYRRDPGVYRDVDPDRFAGGDAPYREVRRSSGSRRR
ncbi:hypothetical protein GQ53DRAFT_754703 [Thozetella sp. PMI_491]|nr:hypothetical protein GQ53DRAFT_754703 [Thozetella sp. PMI_491]